MTQTAIVAAGLSKRYYIPSPQAADPSAGGGFDSPARRRWGRHRAPSGTWIDAVSDLNFDIVAGEAVGLIGRNGAGKSTLLKLLSRVTRPTAGHADVYGRVGALLEVGTGFHPELTGRENTFLSGAILGMSRRDISTRFDEIVAFAEIAPFIDMPVKHYSSGMYARLGFAVAAFLKPAILIVDEILAVGDLGFQAKCLAHMRGLSRDGTTVLFVSHNLLGMADFCPRAMVMGAGCLVFDGPTTEAIGIYRRMLAVPRTAETPVVGRPSHELTINGRPAEEPIECQSNDALHVELVVDQPGYAPPADVELNLVIETLDGRKAIHLRNDLDGTVLRLGSGRTTLTIDIDDLALVPGTYTLWLRVVRLHVASPVIWDTERLPLVVVGDQRWESIVQPRYRFGQLDGADRD
jgi:ABC-type polysaccharide/polyol phosphate transport system ATPase subunit